MHPLYPPYPFAELAKEHLGMHQRQARREHPDHQRGTAARLPGPQADPASPRLRWLVASRPIATFSAWFNRTVARREDRPARSRIDPLMRASTPTELLVLLNARRDEDHEQERAA